MPFGRKWGTANAGWVDVDPSGNKQNTKARKEQEKEDNKWVNMTKEEYEEFVKDKNKVYGVERDGGNFRVKVQK